MNAGAIARDVSNARTLAYWLLAHDRIGSAALAVDSLDSELLCIQGELEDPHGTISTCGLEQEIAAVEASIADADPVVKAQLRALAVKVRGLQRALGRRSESGIRYAVRERDAGLAVGAAARRRALTQASAVLAGSTVLYARTGRAKATGAALAAAQATITSTLRGQQPPQIAWSWGAAAILAPFALGYFRRDPLVATVHVVAGLGSIASTLLLRRRTASRSNRATVDERPELLAVGL